MVGAGHDGRHGRRCAVSAPSTGAATPWRRGGGRARSWQMRWGLVGGDAAGAQQFFGDLVGGRGVVAVGLGVEQLAEAWCHACGHHQRQFWIAHGEAPGVDAGVDVASDARGDAVLGGGDGWARHGNGRRSSTSTGGCRRTAPSSTRTPTSRSAMACVPASPAVCAHPGPSGPAASSPRAAPSTGCTGSPAPPTPPPAAARPHPRPGVPPAGAPCPPTGPFVELAA